MEEKAAYVSSVSLGKYEESLITHDNVVLVVSDLIEKNCIMILCWLMVETPNRTMIFLVGLEVMKAKQALLPGGTMKVKHGNFSKLDLSPLFGFFEKVVFYTDKFYILY